MLSRYKIVASAGSDAGPFLDDSGQDARPAGRGILSAFAHSFQVVTRLTAVTGYAGRTVDEIIGTRRSIE